MGHTSRSSISGTSVHISSMRKRQLKDLAIAAGTNDIDGFIDVVVELTTPPPTVDMNKLRSQIDVWLNHYLLIGVGQLDMAAIMNTGMEMLHENGLVLPADLSLLFRVMLQLQGLGRGARHRRPSHRVAPAAHEAVAGRAVRPRRLARHAGRTIRGWDRLAASLPGDIEEIVRQIRAGRLAIDFRVHDANGAVDHLVDGLVASASVLAPRSCSRVVPARVSGRSAGTGRSRRRRAHLATTRPAPTRAHHVGRPRPRARAESRRHARDAS